MKWSNVKFGPTLSVLWSFTKWLSYDWISPFLSWWGSNTVSHWQGHKKSRKTINLVILDNFWLSGMEQWQVWANLSVLWSFTKWLSYDWISPFHSWWGSKTVSHWQGHKRSRKTINLVILDNFDLVKWSNASLGQLVLWGSFAKWLSCDWISPFLSRWGSKTVSHWQGYT